MAITSKEIAELAGVSRGTVDRALKEMCIRDRGCNLLIVVDAVLGGGEPGTLYRLEGEGLRESMSFRDSMHQTDLVDTLIYCDLAGHRPDAVVIGMEPADYHTMEIGLTPVCQARLPDLAGKVVEELRARGVIA